MLHVRLVHAAIWIAFYALVDATEYSPADYSSAGIQFAIDSCNLDEDCTKITLPSGVYVLDTELIVINNTDPLVIEGEAGAVLDGNESVRILTIGAGGANVSNVRFQFGRCGPGKCTGGALSIEAGGVSRFLNCSFWQNRAVGNGGAVHSVAAVHFEDCRFESNSAIQTISPPSHGGGVYSTGLLVVTRTTFADNWARYTRGGNLYSFGTLTCTDCVIEGGSALYAGGLFTAGVANLYNVSIIDNYSRGAPFGDGGGLFCGGTLTMVDSRIVGNRAYTYNRWLNDNGGGMSANGACVATIENTLFENNKLNGNGISNKAGGAMTVAAGAQIYITNCTFRGNLLMPLNDRKGAAIFNQGYVEISGSLFEGNSGSDGGALYGAGSSTTVVRDSVFIGNSADREGGATSGGAIAVLSEVATLNITGSTFLNNAAVYGGAVYSKGITYIDYDTSNFSSNAGLATVLCAAGSTGCLQCGTSVPGCDGCVQDGAETARDCGGGLCDPCLSGAACLSNSDCLGGICSGAPSTCQGVNGHLSGVFTDDPRLPANGTSTRIYVELYDEFSDPMLATSFRVLSDADSLPYNFDWNGTNVAEMNVVSFDGSGGGLNVTYTCTVDGVDLPTTANVLFWGRYNSTKSALVSESVVGFAGVTFPVFAIVRDNVGIVVEDADLVSVNLSTARDSEDPASFVTATRHAHGRPQRRSASDWLLSLSQNAGVASIAIGGTQATTVNVSVSLGGVPFHQSLSVEFRAGLFSLGRSSISQGPGFFGVPSSTLSFVLVDAYDNPIAFRHYSVAPVEEGTWVNQSSITSDENGAGGLEVNATTVGYFDLLFTSASPAEIFRLGFSVVAGRLGRADHVEDSATGAFSHRVTVAVFDEFGNAILNRPFRVLPSHPNVTAPTSVRSTGAGLLHVSLTTSLTAEHSASLEVVDITEAPSPRFNHWVQGRARVNVNYTLREGGCGCPDHATCAPDGTCECDEGYTKEYDSGMCVSTACITCASVVSRECVAGVCQCRTGYALDTLGGCWPVCTPPCAPSEDCMFPDQCGTKSCGDGILSRGEECDNGVTSCLQDCKCNPIGWVYSPPQQQCLAQPSGRLDIYMRLRDAFEEVALLRFLYSVMRLVSLPDYPDIIRVVGEEQTQGRDLSNRNTHLRVRNSAEPALSWLVSVEFGSTSDHVVSGRREANMLTSAVSVGDNALELNATHFLVDEICWQGVCYSTGACMVRLDSNSIPLVFDSANDGACVASKDSAHCDLEEIDELYNQVEVETAAGAQRLSHAPTVWFLGNAKLWRIPIWVSNTKLVVSVTNTGKGPMRVMYGYNRFPAVTYELAGLYAKAPPLGKRCGFYSHIYRIWSDDDLHTLLAAGATEVLEYSTAREAQFLYVVAAHASGLHEVSFDSADVVQAASEFEMDDLAFSVEIELTDPTAASLDFGVFAAICLLFLLTVCAIIVFKNARRSMQAQAWRPAGEQLAHREATLEEQRDDAEEEFFAKLDGWTSNQGETSVKSTPLVNACIKRILETPTLLKGDRLEEEETFVGKIRAVEEMCVAAEDAGVLPMLDANEVLREPSCAVLHGSESESEDRPYLDSSLEGSDSDVPRRLFERTDTPEEVRAVISAIHSLSEVCRVASTSTHRAFLRLSDDIPSPLSRRTSTVAVERRAMAVRATVIAHTSLILEEYAQIRLLIRSEPTLKCNRDMVDDVAEAFHEMIARMEDFYSTIQLDAHAIALQTRPMTFAELAKGDSSFGLKLSFAASDTLVTGSEDWPKTEESRSFGFEADESESGGDSLPSEASSGSHFEGSLEELQHLQSQGHETSSLADSLSEASTHRSDRSDAVLHRSHHGQTIELFAREMAHHRPYKKGTAACVSNVLRKTVLHADYKVGTTICNANIFLYVLQANHGRVSTLITDSRRFSSELLSDFVKLKVAIKIASELSSDYSDTSGNAIGASKAHKRVLLVAAMWTLCCATQLRALQARGAGVGKFRQKIKSILRDTESLQRDASLPFAAREKHDALLVLLANTAKQEEVASSAMRDVVRTLTVEVTTAKHRRRPPPMAFLGMPWKAFIQLLVAHLSKVHGRVKEVISVGDTRFQRARAARDLAKASVRAPLPRIKCSEVLRVFGDSVGQHVDRGEIREPSGACISGHSPTQALRNFLRVDPPPIAMACPPLEPSSMSPTSRFHPLPPWLVSALAGIGIVVLALLTVFLETVRILINVAFLHDSASSNVPTFADANPWSAMLASFDGSWLSELGPVSHALRWLLVFSNDFFREVNIVRGIKTSTFNCGGLVFAVSPLLFCFATVLIFLFLKKDVLVWLGIKLKNRTHRLSQPYEIIAESAVTVLVEVVLYGLQVVLNAAGGVLLSDLLRFARSCDAADYDFSAYIGRPFFYTVMSIAFAANLVLFTGIPSSQPSRRHLACLRPDSYPRERLPPHVRPFYLAWLLVDAIRRLFLGLFGVWTRGMLVSHEIHYRARVNDIDCDDDNNQQEDVLVLIGKANSLFWLFFPMGVFFTKLQEACSATVVFAPNALSKEYRHLNRSSDASCAGCCACMSRRSRLAGAGDSDYGSVSELQESGIDASSLEQASSARSFDPSEYLELGHLEDLGEIGETSPASAAAGYDHSGVDLFSPPIKRWLLFAASMLKFALTVVLVLFPSATAFTILAIAMVGLLGIRVAISLGNMSTVLAAVAVVA